MTARSATAATQDRASALGATPAIAVADQVLVSAAHFAVGLSVARSGSTAALGLFGVAFLLIGTAADIHRAAIWLPMSQEADARQFRAARRLSVLTGAALGIVALSIAAILAGAGLRDWTVVSLALAVALPLLFLHEIQRRIQFASLRADRAAAADLVYALIAGAGILFLPAFGLGAGAAAVRALMILAMAAGAAALVGAGLLRSIAPSGWIVTKLASRYRSAAGAYILNAGLVFASQRVSMLVIAGMLGLEALANVEAARLLTAPLMVAATGLAAVAVPMTSYTLQHHGARAMLAAIDRIAVMAVVAAGAYGTLLVVGIDSWQRVAFGRQFANASAIAWLFCGIAASSVVATALVAPAGLAGRAGTVPRARVPGVALVAVASVPAAWLFDERALLALVLAEGILTAALLRHAVGRLYPVSR